MTQHNFLPATELGNITRQGGYILDVRTALEHSQNRLETPHDHVPLDELDPEDVMLRAGLTKDDAVYILCRSGKRAQSAADKFGAAGYKNIHVIEGGIIACEDCGQKITGGASNQNASNAPRAAHNISLERQVRIAAGGLVATGVIMGMMVSGAFYFLSLFVGLGLIFAGVTDRCGMALVLAKAPWNKVSGGSCIVRSASAEKQEGSCS